MTTTADSIAAASGVKASVRFGPVAYPVTTNPRAAHAGLAARAEPGRGRSLAGGADRGLFAAQVSSEK